MDVLSLMNQASVGSALDLSWWSASEAAGSPSGSPTGWWQVGISAFVAFVTVFTLAWNIRRSTEERRERRLFEERAQASTVSAWERQWVELNSEDALSSTEIRRLYVHNPSSSPIYDVAVHYADISGVVDADFGTVDDTRRLWLHSVLPPGSEPRTFDVPRTINCGSISEDENLVVEFRDAANRQWRRSEYGTLERHLALEELTPEEIWQLRHKQVLGDITP